MAEKKQEEGIPVTVLVRREISNYPKINYEVKMILVTYIGAGLAPATIQIEKLKYTPQLEKQMIHQDLEARMKKRPETYKV